MAFLSLAKKSFFIPPHVRLLLPRLFSNSDHNSPPHFMVNDYLVSTFGFTPAKAAAISKPISHLKSSQNPEVVRHFLEHQGIDEAGIKTIITLAPNILCSGLENTIAPNLTALRTIGLSTSALSQIIVSSPRVLQLSSAVNRINFWKDFVGGQEAALVKLFKRNRGLVSLDVNGGIATKIGFLQSHGMSKRDIQWIVSTAHQFITSSVSTMEDLLNRAKELGFQPESRMFKHGLLALLSASSEALQKKMELLKSFGWSEDEFLSAILKSPAMLHLSEKNLRSKMEFLLGEAKFGLSYITFRPRLLQCNLEKRMRPRHQVLCLLESKNLSKKRKEFSTAFKLSESKFVERYIIPNKDEIPELHESYLAACTSGAKQTILEM